MGKCSQTSETISRSRRSVARAALFAAVGVQYCPDHWHVPLVKALVIPAHAQTSFSCDDVSVRVFDFDPTPPSGGNASFLIELITQVPSNLGLIVTSATVDSGMLIGLALPEPLSFTESITFAWQGPGVPNSAEPQVQTTLTLDWDCENDGPITLNVDLNAVVRSGAS